MNKDTALDYLPLVKALAEGKVVQGKFLDGWQDLNVVSFDMDACCYRIKPEPREIWANRFPDGYESSACYMSRDQAWSERRGNDAIQVCYREVIE